jgi:hypothetical protein
MAFLGFLRDDKFSDISQKKWEQSRARLEVDNQDLVKKIKNADKDYEVKKTVAARPSTTPAEMKIAALDMNRLKTLNNRLNTELLDGLRQIELADFAIAKKQAETRSKNSDTAIGHLSLEQLEEEMKTAKILANTERSAEETAIRMMATDTTELEERMTAGTSDALAEIEALRKENESSEGRFG